ncbi:PASTA domain-containing protein [Bacteroidales bacterium OttesenSCG-928-A17]|nr:PASTA domain-containing protein [Bacteroidales bacterium OttesenSCG-928-A17]
MNVKKILNNIYVWNILAAIVVLIILVFITLGWLDKYTRHGESVEIPDIKGLTIESAEPFFQAKNLHYQIIDSVFNRDAAPGTVVETVPPIGTRVKEGRTIYVTLNSFSSQLLVVPEVKDYSQRQAIAVLKSVGFENVQTKIVPGAYRDLVLGLERQGVPLEAGERIPIAAPLTLLVSSGQEEIVVSQDSIVMDGSSEESWF